MAWFSRKASDEEAVSDFLEEHTALYRHYCVPETIRIVKQFTGVVLSDEQAVHAVQKIRDQHKMGPIEEHHMPGYVETEK